jgi:hypothetical protein
MHERRLRPTARLRIRIHYGFEARNGASARGLGTLLDAAQHRTCVDEVGRPTTSSTKGTAQRGV